jgi:hypothetical protein
MRPGSWIGNNWQQQVAAAGSDTGYVISNKQQAIAIARRLIANKRQDFGLKLSGMPIVRWGMLLAQLYTQTDNPEA